MALNWPKFIVTGRGRRVQGSGVEDDVGGQAGPRVIGPATRE